MLEGRATQKMQSRARRARRRRRRRSKASTRPPPPEPRARACQSSPPFCANAVATSAKLMAVRSAMTPLSAKEMTAAGPDAAAGPARARCPRQSPPHRWSSHRGNRRCVRCQCRGGRWRLLTPRVPLWLTANAARCCCVFFCCLPCLLGGVVACAGARIVALSAVVLLTVVTRVVVGPACLRRLARVDTCLRRLFWPGLFRWRASAAGSPMGLRC